MNTGDEPRRPYIADDHASSNVEYHEASGTYRTEFDPDTRPVCEAIITAVATATERDPLDVPPLYSVVDIDALATLFTPADISPDGSDRTATFDYAGCHIKVRGRGTVLIEPSTETASS